MLDRKRLIETLTNKCPAHKETQVAELYQKINTDTHSIDKIFQVFDVIIQVMNNRIENCNQALDIIEQDLVVSLLLDILMNPKLHENLKSRAAHLVLSNQKMHLRRLDILQAMKSVRQPEILIHFIELLKYKIDYASSDQEYLQLHDQAMQLIGICCQNQAGRLVLQDKKQQLIVSRQCIDITSIVEVVCTQKAPGKMMQVLNMITQIQSTDVELRSIYDILEQAPALICFLNRESSLWERQSFIEKHLHRYPGTFHLIKDKSKKMIIDIARIDPGLLSQQDRYRLVAEERDSPVARNIIIKRDLSNIKKIISLTHTCTHDWTAESIGNVIKEIKLSEGNRIASSYLPNLDQNQFIALMSFHDSTIIGKVFLYHLISKNTRWSGRITMSLLEQIEAQIDQSAICLRDNIVAQLTMHIQAIGYLFTKKNYRVPEPAICLTLEYLDFKSRYRFVTACEKIKLFGTDHSGTPIESPRIDTNGVAHSSLFANTQPSSEAKSINQGSQDIVDKALPDINQVARISIWSS